MSSEENVAPPSARDRIIMTAGNLFYREGYRAIGVDRVIAEADVAKATFYRHFPSKDDLIVAWVESAEKGVAATLPPADSPTALTDYVDLMLRIARRPACVGCTYQGAAGEFVAQDHPAHKAARGVKERVIADLALRARSQGLRAPDEVAQEVFLVIEGLWAATRMFGPDAPFAAAERAALRIIRAAA
ncbi:MAG: TetR/AcrR family transcriptional regulator [Paracoccaceae bacterium]